MNSMSSKVFSILNSFSRFLRAFPGGDVIVAHFRGATQRLPMFNSFLFEAN